MEEKQLLEQKSTPLAKLMESPEAAVKLLNSIKTNFAQLLKDNDEIITIQTKQGPKDYVRYEGWVTIATVMGIMPQITEIQQLKLENGHVQGYQAKAIAVVVKTGETVGAAYGMCSKDEPTWALRPDFAVASMAQTRACAKSLKMILSGVITHLGYEGTPAEIAEETQGEEPKGEPPVNNDPCTEKQINCIYAIGKKNKLTEKDIKDEIMQLFQKEHIKDLTITQASQLIDWLQKQK